MRYVFSPSLITSAESQRHLEETMHITTSHVPYNDIHRLPMPPLTAEAVTMATCCVQYFNLVKTRLRVEIPLTDTAPHSSQFSANRQRLIGTQTIRFGVGQTTGGQPQTFKNSLSTAITTASHVQLTWRHQSILATDASVNHSALQQQQRNCMSHS